MTARTAQRLGNPRAKDDFDAFVDEALESVEVVGGEEDDEILFKANREESRGSKARHEETNHGSVWPRSYISICICFTIGAVLAAALVSLGMSKHTRQAATPRMETSARAPVASPSKAVSLEPSSGRLEVSKLKVTTSIPTAPEPRSHSPKSSHSHTHSLSSHFPYNVSIYRLQVVKTYPHDPKAFTQGLVYLGNDTLYESTGWYGESSVRKVDLKTGEVLASNLNSRREFGEGLTYYKGFFWQVIWQTRTIHQYDPITLKSVGTYSTPAELDFRDGWGLASTSDGLSRFHDKAAIPPNETLYLTDSGTKLYQIEFVDGRFKLIRKVSVRTPTGALLEMPNELELIDEHMLWANIFGKDCIAQINPETGKVIGWILADNLEQKLKSPNNVFNGIAYDRKNKRIFVTGKRWNLMYEVKLVPEKGIAQKEAARLCVPRMNTFRR